MIQKLIVVSVVTLITNTASAVEQETCSAYYNLCRNIEQTWQANHSGLASGRPCAPRFAECLKTGTWTDYRNRPYAVEKR